jgi:uncharacterized coiled-coil DUF342 family protein
MDEKALNDLKQFITATIHQEIASLETRIDTRFEAINARFDENDTMQNEILNAIGENQELHSKAIHYQANNLDDHERRIVKLEKRAA